MRTSIAFVVCLLTGCGTKPTANRGSWLIEGWTDGIFTIQHDGYTYKATCDDSVETREGRTTVNGIPFSEPTNDRALPNCDLAVGLVGQSVETVESDLLPAGGKQKDADGWIVTMTHAQRTLMLQWWRDKDTHIQELFKITSVTKSNR